MGMGRASHRLRSAWALLPVSPLRLAGKDCLPMDKAQRRKGQKGHFITNHSGPLLPLTSLSGDSGLKWGPIFSLFLFHYQSFSLALG